MKRLYYTDYNFTTKKNAPHPYDIASSQIYNII